KLARRVTHRHVARAHDIGEDGGQYFLTMEFIDGESLAQILLRREPLSCERIVAIARAVCQGLAAAHTVGVIHCDLKPENILVSREGRIVLSDFGVAAECDLQYPTLPGQAGGTPVYMSPEQIEGRVLDFRTDLYALGILLYEMLTGSPPWSRDRGTMSASVARLSVPASDPRSKNPSIPESVAKYVLHLLEREPANRPASAGDVGSTLGSMLETGRATPVPTSSARPPRRSSLAPPQLATTNTPHTRGVAVMMLRNLGDEKTAYVAEAVTDELSNHLAKSTGLRVAARASAQMRDGEDLRTFGARLNVQAVVEGSLLVKTDGSMRLTVRLTEVERGFSLFSTRVDRKADDLFSIAQEIATKVAEALTVEANADGPAPAAKAAVDPFLRARRAYGVRTHAGAQEATSLLEEGLARSPKDPLLLSWLALAKLQLWEFEPAMGESGSIRREVRRLAEGVLSNDATSGEAHLALAMLLSLQGDPPAAMTAANEAVRCNPTLGEAHLLLGRIHSEAGRLAEGIHRLALALRIDPKST
ncbi:MAG TPA: protein kinase, partial [Polyangiaceae bacterium]